ncbi:MAG TPA: TonB-dependent receptor [Longimicrobium sp.]|jgi:outer membrane cobalamin receptor
MRRSGLLLLLTMALVATTPIPAAAQFPGELAGTVRDAATGAPVEAASVELPATGQAARTDGSGAFRIRGLEPGAWRVLVRRAGYAGREVGIEVENGRTARLDVALHPLPVALDPLRVSAARETAEGTRFTRAEIEASGARTAAEVAERAPGVVVREAGPTGARTISIRGSAPDAVLVLVDGAPLNDPVSGEADLSAVPAGSIESLAVLPGARAARYGPRAQAGVVLIETRAAGARQSAEVSAGTLGEWAGRLDVGARTGGLGWSAGGHLRRVGGEFDHPRDVNDPTVVRRENADLGEWSAFGALSARTGGGELRARGGWDALERGLPGMGHTPSPHARQEMGRGRGSLGWRRAAGSSSLGALVTGAVQRVRYADPQPPFGLAYDDTTRVRSLTARLDADHAPAGDGWLRGLGGGVEGSLQRVDAGALGGQAPRTRRDFGAFVHLLAGRTAGAADVTFSAEGRIDRDGVTDDWYLSRSLTLGAGAGALRLQLANRSSYSPPSLGDQFFREGVGVRPNPDLGPERVPGEWELGASWSPSLRGLDLTASVAAYTGDVRGMIVWLPDFAFRWSPRNVDVDRRGLDARAEAALPAADLRLVGSWSAARIVYDSTGAGEAVQLAYRPRHFGFFSAEWSPGAWRAGAAARYTGLRYPAAARVNALPGFWSVDLDLAREWRIGRWAAEAALHVDRLFDETSSLIAGFPEPGRRLRLDLRVRRADLPTP